MLCTQDIVNLLKKRLNQDKPQKQYLGIVLVGRVMSECPDAVGLLQEELLQEVAKIMAKVARPDNEEEQVKGLVGGEGGAALQLRAPCWHLACHRCPPPRPFTFSAPNSSDCEHWMPPTLLEIGNVYYALLAPEADERAHSVYSTCTAPTAAHYWFACLLLLLRPQRAKRAARELLRSYGRAGTAAFARVNRNNHAAFGGAARPAGQAGPPGGYPAYGAAVGATFDPAMYGDAGAADIYGTGGSGVDGAMQVGTSTVLLAAAPVDA